MRILTADQAAELITDGATVACAGFVGAGHAEAVTSAIERRFEATGAPRDLTLVYSAGQGDRGRRGVNHFGSAGMTTRIVGGHGRSAPRLGDLAMAEQAEGYNLPQGVISHLFRAIAGGKPGVITKTGLHTFVDPRYQGDAVNQLAMRRRAQGRGPQNKSWPGEVEHLRLHGEDHLLYNAFPIDFAFIRATEADAKGNLSTHEEPFHQELLAIAQAARNSGGMVIAQVKRMVDAHKNLQAVHVPGILVDVVVVCDDVEAEHQMTFGETWNPAYCEPARAAVDAGAGAAKAAVIPKDMTAGGDVAALDARAIVQRRAVLELIKRRPRVVNLGVGMPAAVGALAEKHGARGFTLTVEAGPIGGTPADGLSFGASAYPEAVVDQPAQFDFYDGGGIDLAFLGLAELDAAGNVNVSLFGEGESRLLAGVGGFINITQSARALVFMGTLTAGGLKVEAADGRLRIVQEGRMKKIVPEVGHLTFNGAYAASLGIPVVYITERAVFEMRGDRLTLTEIAPGVDLQRDVLDQCGAAIAVADNLQEMDARVFTEALLAS
ncbi:MAG: malonate decarboxylase subunit alpha [Candidatus Protistobacter heckmanni]|nr:malonate decarboxylase subunit alpha [Candidatus Protistobacter heckmanni]